MKSSCLDLSDYPISNIGFRIRIKITILKIFGRFNFFMHKYFHHFQCNSNERCDKVSMNSQESFRCVPHDMGYCQCVGDPHCTTFDGMQHDVYGLGMYQAAANFGQGVPEFQWAFDTYEFARTGHAAIDKYAF